MKQIDIFLTILFTAVAALMLPVHVERLFSPTDPYHSWLPWKILSDLCIIGIFTYKAVDKGWLELKTLKYYSIVCAALFISGTFLYFEKFNELPLVDMLYFLPAFVIGLILWTLISSAYDGKLWGEEEK